MTADKRLELFGGEQFYLILNKVKANKKDIFVLEDDIDGLID